MKALLLAAGLGTRLKPITDTIPKCLVPINGKPLLQFWLEQLSNVGVTEFHINTHYFAEQVEAFAASMSADYNITLHYEPELTGTLGTLSNLSECLFNDEQSVLVAHSDNLIFCNWQAFIDYHKNSDSDLLGTMMTFTTDRPESCGIVETDSKQRLIAFHEKVNNPPSNHASGAVFLFRSSLQPLLSIPQMPVPAEISLSLIPLLIGRLNCWHNHDYLRDIGSPESLAMAEQESLKYMTNTFHTDHQTPTTQELR